MKTDRRHFLAGAAGLVAASALPRAAAADAGATRVIPSTGQAVPAVGLGSWITFNVGDDPVLLDACAEVIAAFVDEGGGVIDSSPMYGSSQGTIGYGLARLGHPASVFRADKVWTGSVAEGPEQIARSRAEWGVPAFDLLQVHNLVEWPGHLETLFAMKAEGALGAVGITTSHGRRHEELERVMRDHPVDFVQLTYNVADREAEARLLPLAREKGIAVIVNRPFRQGALTERLDGEALPAVAAELGATSWAQLILKFILSHPGVTVAIPATTRVDHLRENKAAARGPLPDEAGRAEIGLRGALMEEWLSYRLGDFLMFSGRTYWRLFELQNEALWPLPIVAPAVFGCALLLVFRRHEVALGLLAGLLAIAWISVGWGFVWQRYAAINWGLAYAAPLFGVQALLLGRAAVRRAGRPPALQGTRGVAGLALIGWAVLLHPFAAPLFGRALLGAEVVGIAPDPTAIATLGLALLLPTRSLRLTASVIPALWLGFSGLTLHLLDAPERLIPLAALPIAAAGLALGRRGG